MSPRSVSGRPSEIPDFPALLDAVIERARTSLAADQRPDGAWETPTDVGPIGPAMQWIVEHRFGVLEDDDAAEAARYLLAAQQADGSFLPYPGAPAGSASATALCRAGLLAC